MQQEISDQTTIDWLRLALTKNIGPRTFITLMEIFNNDPAAAIRNLPNLARKSLRSLAVCPPKDALTFLENLKRFNSRVILSCHRDYPSHLLQIDDRPPFIIVRGRLELLSLPKIGIVGARDSSTNGNIIARRLAKELGEAGIVIVSGLARGIDTAAHEGSLATGSIGVVAGGIDYVYPRENEHLYRKLYEVGLVISEKPLSCIPSAENFPQRNRIISGLSLGVIVVEASKRSGTLITANYAAEQGREVFAVPGSPLDNRHEGTNSLIQNGAMLVQNSEDVIKNLYWLQERETACSYIEDSAKQPTYRAPKSNPTPLDQPIQLTQQTTSQSYNIYSEYITMQNAPEVEKIRELLISKLSFNPVCFSEIAAEMDDIPAELLNIILVELEISGKVERKYGNNICLVAEQ